MNPCGSRRSRALPLLIAIVVPLGLTGCGSLAADIPKAAVPGVIEGGLKAMDDPANRRRLEHIVGNPDVKVLNQELVGNILDGSLSALDEHKRVERAGEITARYTAGLLHGFSRDVAPELAPATAAAMHGVMDGTMNVVMSEANQARMQHLVGSLVQASVDPVVKSLSDAELSGTVSSAMTRDLGPALQQVLRENLGPGIAEALSHDEVKRALGDTAHALGRELILGANEGLSKVQEHKSSDDDSLLGSVSSLAHQGATASKFLPWVLAAMVLGLTVWVVKLLSQTRRFRNETEQRAETTRVLNEAIRAADGKPWSSELLGALEDRFQSDEEALLRIQAARANAQRGRGARVST